MKKEGIVKIPNWFTVKKHIVMIVFCGYGFQWIKKGVSPFHPNGKVCFIKPKKWVII